MADLESKIDALSKRLDDQSRSIRTLTLFCFCGLAAIIVTIFTQGLQLIPDCVMVGIQSKLPLFRSEWKFLDSQKTSAPVKSAASAKAAPKK